MAEAAIKSFSLASQSGDFPQLRFTCRKLSLILFLGSLLTLSFSTIGCGSLGNSSASSSQPHPSPTPAPPPTAGQHSVDLSWNASNSTVSGYNVYRGSQSGGPYSKVNNSLEQSTTYNDTSVQSGSTYFYVVTAVDASSQESLFSNESEAVIPNP